MHRTHATPPSPLPPSTTLPPPTLSPPHLVRLHSDEAGLADGVLRLVQLLGGGGAESGGEALLRVEVGVGWGCKVKNIGNRIQAGCVCMRGRVWVSTVRRRVCKCVWGGDRRWWVSLNPKLEGCVPPGDWYGPARGALVAPAASTPLHLHSHTQQQPAAPAPAPPPLNCYPLPSLPPTHPSPGASSRDGGCPPTHPPTKPTH